MDGEVGGVKGAGQRLAQILAVVMPEVGPQRPAIPGQQEREA
jgi:hypothetical protein